MTADAVVLDRWTCAPAPAGSAGSPADLDAADLDWLPFEAPGTVAAALRAAGRWPLPPATDLDADDWWFRCSFPQPDGGGWDLVLDGVATLADVWLNDAHLLASSDMFVAHRAPVDAALAPQNDLVIRCAALAPVLATRRRPRPRWKARLPADQGLRWVRTTLIGRSPAWTPSVAPVGPWRPVTLRRRPAVAVGQRHQRVHHDGTDGSIDLRVRLDVAGPVPTDAAVELLVGRHRAPLATTHEDGALVATGRLVAPGVEPWWPATHGRPTLHPARLAVTLDQEVVEVDLGPVGFRSVSFARADAPVLRWNGVDLFCRGACWAPLDITSLTARRDDLRAALQQLVDAGCNVVRIQGSLVPESDDFYALCDDLGLLVWHDLPFAVLDYPVDDDGFRAEVSAEVAATLDRLATHPSLAVVCGGSEVYQQAAMLGRTADGPDRLFDEVVADLVAAHAPDVAYWPSSPTWSGPAFGVDSGVAHYFGVGGYQRPLADARTSGVKFASECLAFSHLPGDQSHRELQAAGIGVGSPAWKAGVPRDAGRAWDFEDVRDHYVVDRFGVDPGAVRAVDPGHYLDLGRAAVAEVVAATFAEWRRPASPCSGAIVLQARDLLPGAGFGVVDTSGRPKATWHAMARVLQPVAVMFTDEGLNGLDVHLHNDGAEDLEGTLAVRAYSGPHLVADGTVPCTVEARRSTTVRADEVLGGFYDLTWAYRFGPRSISAVAATWQVAGGSEHHAVHLPSGPLQRHDVGLQAELRPLDERRTELVITTREPARCILVDAPGATPADDAFDLEPGRAASVVLVHDGGPVNAEVRCVNGLHPVSARPADG